MSARIAIVGAGSAVFTRNLCSDILLAEPLRDSTIALMDVDAGRLEGARALVQELIDARGLPARVEATARPARGGDGRGLRRHHLPAGRPGGLRAGHRDPAAATASSSASAIRSAPAACSARCARSPCCSTCAPTWTRSRPTRCCSTTSTRWPPTAGRSTARTGRPHVGLCHSVQGTSEMLARVGRRALRRGGVPLRRHQPPGVLPRVPPRRGGPLPGDPRGGRARGDLRLGAGADRPDAPLRLLRDRVQRPRQRVLALLPQERADGRGGARPALHLDPRTTGSTSGAPAATCATASARAARRRRAGGEIPDRAHARVRLVHHRGDGDRRAVRAQRQRAQPRADREPAGRLLRRGAVPGRRQRRAADGRGRAAAAARRAQPHQHQRAGADRRGGADRRHRGGAPRGLARPADRRRLHARSRSAR